MRHILIAALIAAPLFFSRTADASPTREQIAQRVEDVFKRLDTDKNGQITRAEADKGPRMKRHFDQVDADKNGGITRAELTQAIEKKVARREEKRKEKQKQN